MEILERIENKKAVIGIIGLGYVGLPLVIEFLNAGFHVIGFDIDENKVAYLNQGKSYIRYIDFNRLMEYIQDRRFNPTSDFSRLALVDCIILCVPTPLSLHKEPDMTYVFNTTETVVPYLHKDQLIVIESTTYPGTTEEDIRKILEKTGLKAGEDFYLAYSPERVDPNNRDFTMR
ncbi:MAG TPA: NAD(P)-binding domain-containing protein, partial [Syntrophorhabdaceae bacterium]|nr:NAD(P)-binding domain-containing protein [Syntrophorhabdaceae bacterium]